MKLQIHGVTDWDITSKHFEKTDKRAAFEMRVIHIKSPDGDIKIDLFLEKENEPG
jgi:hypothetical protein